MSAEDRQFRARLLMASLVLVFLLLIGRLAQLQVIFGAELDEAARRQRVRPLVVPAPRGQILDREGAVLAGSRPAFTASLVFTGEPMPDETRQVLQKILDIHDDDINAALAQLARTPFQSARLKVDLSPEEHTRLEESRHVLPGVVVEVLPVRWYPHGQLASHVLGHVQAGDEWAVVGALGVERVFDNVVERPSGTFQGLTGSPGRQVVEVDSVFRPSRILVQEEPVMGNDVLLTIDMVLQAAAEEALATHMEFLRETESGPCPCPAPAAAAVVLRVDSGEILAMASLPAFDPNVYALRPFLRSGSLRRTELNQILAGYQQNPFDPSWNRAMQARYPPGSVFKMATGIAAIEAGLGNLKVHSPGYLIYGNRRLSDWQAHGLTDLVKAIGRSSNVHFWTLGIRLGVQRMGDAAAQFGLDGPSGLIDLPGEAPAAFPWHGDVLNVPIGQGEHLYSPLHIANYIAIIAQGECYRPYVVGRVVDPEGSIVYEAEPEILGRPEIADSDLEIIREGMRSVTGRRAGWWGTAYARFQDAPYVVAGKTGTVERGGRMESNTNHGWFAAYGPAERGTPPEIAVAVVVEGGGGGSLAAAPVARKIFDVYFENRPLPFEGLSRDDGAGGGSSQHYREPR
ncbi:MAG: penicillin-binding transpeptidase domain-containing protein [Thermaerobacterales bacterium]